MNPNRKRISIRRRWLVRLGQDYNLSLGFKAQMAVCGDRTTKLRMRTSRKQVVSCVRVRRWKFKMEENQNLAGAVSRSALGWAAPSHHDSSAKGFVVAMEHSNPNGQVVLSVYLRCVACCLRACDVPHPKLPMLGAGKC